MTPDPSSGVREIPEGPRAGRVLVVDDERVVLDLARAALQRAGFDVLLASDGAEALTMWDEHAAGIALVLADVAMPRVNGVELLAEIRRRGHEVPVVLMSGDLSRRSVEGATAILSKPFRVADLVAMVRRFAIPAA